MLQLLHYALAPAQVMPPFPPEWGTLPQGPRDGRFSFLHSGIDGAFYVACTQGPGGRPGWVPKPPHTRLWTVQGSPSQVPEYELLGPKDVAALQGEYESILRAALREGQFAIVPDL